MNGAAPFGDQCSTAPRFLRCTIRTRGQRETVMTSAMTAFGIAVGSSSLLYLLITRLQNGRRSRRLSRDSSGPDSGTYAGSDGWGLSSWFSSGDSASDNSCNSSGGGDSGGGGDSLGGGDGGGGGD